MNKLKWIGMAALVIAVLLAGCDNPAGNNENQTPGNETPGNETPGNETPEAIFVVAREGIRFYVHDNVSEEDRAAFETEVGELTDGFLVEYAVPYILRWIRAASLPGAGDWTMQMEGERAIVYSLGTISIMYEFWQVGMAVRDELGLGDSGDVPYFERTSTDGNNTIRFEQDAYDSDSFEALKAEAEALTSEQVDLYAQYIDVVIQVEAGSWGDYGRWSPWEEDGRMLFFRDGTAGTLAQDLAWARESILSQDD